MPDPGSEEDVVAKIPKIAVIGSYMTDLVTMVPRLPRRGETIAGGPFFMGSGGKGSNQAIALARLGAEVVAVVSVGADDFGKAALELFKNEGIGTGRVLVRDGYHTGMALIVVDSTNGDNQIAIAPGANEAMTGADVEAAEADIAGSDCMLLQLEIPAPAVKAAIDLAGRLGIRVILNPAPYRELDRGLYRKVGILTPNEHEAGLITGIGIESVKDARMAAEKIMSMGCRAVVITLGDNGVLVMDERTSCHLPPHGVKVTDTTGAGDSFNGALAYSIAKGMSLKDAAAFANAAAAVSVTRRGTAVAMPRLDEVEALMAAQAASCRESR